jgi:hypothetical protein
MRIGKWAPTYRNIVPIPRMLALAFGLIEGSELHLAPITETSTAEAYKHGCEVIVSPVPIKYWQSACRLSVRLRDRPHALAVATDFLRENKINILVSESCSTYQQRAHWDAICDLSESQLYTELRGQKREDYAEAIEIQLNKITKVLENWIEEPTRAPYFLGGTDKHAQFSPLTGLNDAAFVCAHTQSVKLIFRAGGIELPRNLTNIVCGNTDTTTLPKYAMITGNTEQRYLRILFMRDYDNMFKLVIKTKLSNFAGGGVGVLNQLLKKFPPKINLIKVSTYILGTESYAENNIIEIIGHWNDYYSSAEHPQKQNEMKRELMEIVDNMDIIDADNVSHTGALETLKFRSPDDIYPRVFVSHSADVEAAKLDYLLTTLWENGFRPVTSKKFFKPDLAESAFKLIDTCVALVSLQIKRDDFKVAATEASKGNERYILPPWFVAEEVYAWSKGMQIFRLKDEDVEEPRYNRHLRTISFTSSDVDDYRAKVRQLVNELNEFRQDPEFQGIELRAREALFVKINSPSE